MIVQQSRIEKDKVFLANLASTSHFGAFQTPISNFSKPEPKKLFCVSCQTSKSRKLPFSISMDKKSIYRSLDSTCYLL